MTVFTTLNKIRSNSPCTEGWTKLLAYLGKTKADDEPISLVTILESNGIEDAIWCLQALDGYEREIRLFTVACARQVQHLMTDKRSTDALDVAERFAKGEATREELSKAREATSDAAADTADAADAANVAAYYAAYYAADAADAARYAADAADAARYAAYTARAARAAHYAADAAYYAAADAVDAARAAYYAAADAANAAADARTKQADLFREFFG